MRLGDDPQEKLQWLQRLKAEGHNPKILQERTEVRPDLLVYWQAFTVLSASRPTGFGIGRIPFSEISAYLDRFPDPDPDVFITLIQAMDRTYTEHHANQRQKNR